MGFRPRLSASLIAWTVLLAGPVLAQEPTTPEREQATQAQGSTCLEPPPMVRWQDYNGPFAKLVGTVGGKLDRTSINQPHYKPGSVLCSLGVKDKFVLFLQDSVDPVTLFADVFNSGLDQAENAESRFGQGMQGFGKRLGANTASDVSGRFFSEFLFPTALSEDPRYYRLGRGSGGHRLLHALGHAFIAHQDNGKLMPNFAEWAGTTAGVLLSDVYHPGSTHGPGPIAWQVSSNILQDTGFDVLREFWPEIARKLRIPFRAASPPTERPVQ
ncbi:MAG TPA: hypothetical protein VGR73_06265 [Bryobacteraceae bacterium]|nr:hypothetical protein [Bryobacteraceae bacterium]